MLFSCSNISSSPSPIFLSLYQKNLLSSLPFLKTNSNSRFFILTPILSPFCFYCQDSKGAVFIQSPFPFPLPPQSSIVVSFSPHHPGPSGALAQWLAPPISDMTHPSWTPLLGHFPFRLPFCLPTPQGALAEHTGLIVFGINRRDLSLAQLSGDKGLPPCTPLHSPSPR